MRLPPNVHSEDIAQDVAEMIARKDTLDRETAEEKENRERREESTSLLAFLNSINEPEAEACVAVLMNEWSGSESVYSYYVGTHTSINYLDYVITHADGWYFECQENRSSWPAFTLRDGLRIAKAMQRDNI